MTRPIPLKVTIWTTGSTTVTDDDVFAVKGEWVTCENDHNICMVAKDISKGDLWESGQFTRWHQPPEPGALECRCTRCDAPYFREGQYHIGKEWRS